MSNNNHLNDPTAGSTSIARIRRRTTSKRFPFQGEPRALHRSLSRAALALILLATLALAPMPTEAQTTLSLPTVSGEPGQMVVVPFSLAGTGTASALQIDLLFDPDALEAVVAPGPDLGQHQVRSSSPQPGLLRVVIYPSSTIPLGSGDLALLHIDIDPDAPEGDSPLELSLALVSDADAMAIPGVALQSGNIQIVAAAPPAITTLSTIPNTGDGQLVPAERTATSITQVWATFSRAVLDEAGDSGSDDVTNPANYILLVDSAGDGFQTSSCAAGVAPTDTAVPFAQVSYDSASKQAVLQVSGSALPEGSYRLMICGTTSIVSLTGRPLDGDGNGTGGDDFRRDFHVTRTNLLVNPNFDISLDGWTISSPQPAAIRHAIDDAEEASSSGSAEAVVVNGAGQLFALGQCVPVTGPTSYRAGARLRVSSGLPAAPMDFAVADFFASTNCSGGVLVRRTSTAVLGDTAGAWVSGLGGSLASPANARSAFVSFVFDASSAVSFTGNLDHLLFFREGIFEDGFETGNTSQWDVVIP